MRILIIEDEEIAAGRLKKLVKQYNQNIEVMDVLDSINAATEWFRKNELPDLLFLDIQLADGLSFEIFNRVDIKVPVIFVTAYDDYAIRAFQLNSIDYLLKPIDYEELEIALNKFEQLKEIFSDSIVTRKSIELIEQYLSGKGNAYKERFIVKLGTHIYPVYVSDIICFSSIEGSNHIHTQDKKYIFEMTLDKVEQVVDPALFYRVNRNYIIKLSFIKELVKYSRTQYKIKMMFYDEDILLSRDRAAHFKKWLDS